MGINKYTLEDFLKKANEKHNNKYSYEDVDYRSSQIKIKILCPKHGIFLQLPSAHISGHGCPTCMGKNMNTKSFIERAKETHGDKYNYEKVNYNKSKEKVIITCKSHGDFEQAPDKHLRGRGCRRCANNKLYEERVMSHTSYLRKCKKIHGSIYDYSKTEYKGMKCKITIKCSKHGDYIQMADKHLLGRGCPKCSHHISKSETEIANYLIGKGYKVILNKRGILGKLELDIFLPELNKAIEFNGTYWHYSDRFFIPGKHALKSKLCREKGITLLHVREDLWLKDKEKMKQVISRFIEDLGDLIIKKHSKNK